jgi:hypothetical protein
LLLLGCFLAGCSRHEAVLDGAGGSPSAPAAPPAVAAAGAEAPPAAGQRLLAHAKSTEWELCEEVLRCLQKKDAVALNQLRVTEKEYKDYLFPEFPAAKTEVKNPEKLHWELLNLRSARGVQNAIDDFGGQELELLDVVPERVEAFPTYNVLHKVELKVRRKLTGEETQIRVFGSIVELDGQYKIVGFPT